MAADRSTVHRFVIITHTSPPQPTTIFIKLSTKYQILLLRQAEIENRYHCLRSVSFVTCLICRLNQSGQLIFNAAICAENNSEGLPIYRLEKYSNETRLFWNLVVLEIFHSTGNSWAFLRNLLSLHLTRLLKTILIELIHIPTIGWVHRRNY